MFLVPSLVFCQSITTSLRICEFPKLPTLCSIFVPFFTPFCFQLFLPISIFFKHNYSCKQRKFYPWNQQRQIYAVIPCHAERWSTYSTSSTSVLLLVGCLFPCQKWKQLVKYTVTLSRGKNVRTTTSEWWSAFKIDLNPNQEAAFLFRILMVPTPFEASTFQQLASVMSTLVQRENCRIAQLYTTANLIGLFVQPICRSRRVVLQRHGWRRLPTQLSQISGTMCFKLASWSIQVVQGTPANATERITE